MGSLRLRSSGGSASSAVPGRSYAQTRVKAPTPGRTAGGATSSGRTVQAPPVLPPPEMRTTVGPPCPRHWRIHLPPAADVDQPREVAWVASVDDWGGGLCHGERHNVPPQRELVVAQSRALGRDGDRLQRVVIGQHVFQGRRLAGELEGVEDVGQAVGDHDRRAVGHLEVQVRPTRWCQSCRRWRWVAPA